MATINVEGMSKRYGDEEYAIRDVNFEIEDQEIFMLLGPSGCGKTTTMNIMAGFIDPTEGRVTMDGEEIRDPSPDKGVIFQDTDSAIFPWRTTIENVKFGLKMIDYPKDEREERAEEVLDIVGLLDAKDKFPRELSGGMKQRIQIARSLAVDPDILLADEPFASLDAQTQQEMQDELLRVWEHSKKTIAFVTHNIEEAVRLGHRIAVFSPGPNAIIKDVIDVPMDYPRKLSSEECEAKIRRARQLIGVEER